MPTPLYHATISGGGPTGISFRIGEALCFTSPDDAQIYLVTDPTVLVEQTPVPPSMVATLMDTIIEPRLHTLLTHA